MSKINLNSYLLLVTVVCLLLIGIIILTSVSTVYSQEKFGNPYHFLFHQLAHMVAGLIAAFAVYKIRLDFLKKYSTFLFIGNIILLAAVFIPGLNFATKGAKRWIQLGPVTLQPVEFLKLSFIIFLSAWMAKLAQSNFKKKRKGAMHPIVICVSLFLITALMLFFQPDLSSLAVIGAIMVIIYFLSETPSWHIILLLLVLGLGFFYVVRAAPHASNRIAVYLDPDYDPMGLGYQVRQVQIAIGSGGLFGLGVGMSNQKFGFLPEIMSDTIFATFAEETGFLGSSLLLALFLSFLWVGFKISRESTDRFNSLAAAGITSWIIIQAFVNMGAMLRIIPLTGIAMPFISYGGSHLIAELMAIGLLLNISNNSTKR